MPDATPLPFDLPSVRRKKLTVDFDGGNQSSDAGLLLLRQAERKLGVCRRLADAMPDRRDPDRIRHDMFEMVMERAAAIACGHEDAIDLDRLRHDPLKVAVGRCPDSGAPLASQSTISRLENAPSKTEAARLAAALLDQFGTTVEPGRLEILDIDDTFCAAHGGQQLAFWNAHHDERGFASMHIYHVASGTPVATILRPARTPKGTEVRTVIKHVTKRLRQHWPNTRIVWRGDSHYGRVEAMEWAENDGDDYIFGLPGNAALDAQVAETADNLRFHHAKSTQTKLRTYASFTYQAGRVNTPDLPLCSRQKSWHVSRVQFSGRPARGRHRQLQRFLRAGIRRLQCRPQPGQGMDRTLRRSPRSQGRSDRLGRTHPVSRDPQLCPA